MPIALPRAARLTLACLALTLAHLPAPCAADPASQHLREQRQAAEQLDLQQRLRRWQPRPSEPAAAANPEPRNAGPCVAVSGLQLVGNRLLDAEQLQPVVQPLLQPCMDVAAINQLLRAITERYVQAGYPLVRPYLRSVPQAGQALDILINEGYVESLELSEALPLSLHGAFPGLLGQPLHLPELEQGLDQLNRLRAYDLGVDLLPGQAPGATRVAITPREVGKRWHLYGSFDNRGDALTGRHRMRLGLGLDSPLGVNDALRLTLSGTAAKAPGHSRGLNLDYNVPYGPWSFTLNANHYEYRSVLAGGQAASGGGRFHGLGVERLLWRNQQGMLSATVRLDSKRLDNYINGSRIQLQSASLTTLDAGLNLLWLQHGVWGTSLGVSQGLATLGAERPASGKGSPQPDFRKYRASLYYLGQAAAPQPWRWQSELNLQYSAEALPAAEQLLLSDTSSVRGVRQHSVAGASGAVWRNTLSYPFFPLDRADIELRPFLGVDLGWARYAPGSAPERLAGGAVGVELSLPGQHIRLDYQRALHASDRSRHNLEPGIWGLEWRVDL